MTNEERRANRKGWKNARYGLRWMAEIIISAFKRVFGESVRVFASYMALIEAATKVATYNRRWDIWDEVVQELTSRRTRLLPHDAEAARPSVGWDELQLAFRLPHCRPCRHGMWPHCRMALDPPDRNRADVQYTGLGRKKLGQTRCIGPYWHHRPRRGCRKSVRPEQFRIATLSSMKPTLKSVGPRIDLSGVV